MLAQGSLGKGYMADLVGSLNSCIHGYGHRSSLYYRSGVDVRIKFFCKKDKCYISLNTVIDV